MTTASNAQAQPTVVKSRILDSDIVSYAIGAKPVDKRQERVFAALALKRLLGDRFVILLKHDKHAISAYIAMIAPYNAIDVLTWTVMSKSVAFSLSDVIGRRSRVNAWSGTDGWWIRYRKGDKRHIPALLAAYGIGPELVKFETDTSPNLA